MAGPFKAIRSYAKAIQLIRIHGWWGYVFAPGIISLALIVTAIFFGFDAVNYLFDGLDTESWPQWTEVIWLPWILKTLTKILVFIVIFVLYKSLVLVISAPMLSILAEKTAKVIGLSSQAQMEWHESILRSFWVNLKYAWSSFVWLLVSLLSSFLPFVGPFLFSAINFVSQSYFAGAGLLDFGFEMKGYDATKSAKMVKKHRMAVGGLGMCFSGLLAIPVVGWFFAPPLAVIAGTILSAELD